MNSFENKLRFGFAPLHLLAGMVNFAVAEESITELDQNLEAFDDYEILPKGSYPATCILAEKRISDSGNEYYYTNWRIDPSDYPADYDADNAPEGTTLNYSRVQAPKPNDRRSITNVKKLYKAMGLSLKTATIDPSTWVDQKAMLVVGAEVYNGERRNSIVSIETLDA